MKTEKLFDDPETLAGLEDLPTAPSSLDQYQRELAKLPLLSREDEIEIARRAKAGEPEALEQLVSANLRYAFSVAKKYRGRGMELEDLVAEANAGLLTAASKFDPERGHKFISYAVWWIRRGILKALPGQALPARIPLHRARSMAGIAWARSRLRGELARDPTLGELAKETGISQEDIEAVGVLLAPPLRLGHERRDQRPFDLTDEGSDTAAGAMQEGRTEAIGRALEGLSPREARILRLSFGLEGEELTLRQIASLFGLSAERVRQIRQKALQKLRNNPELAIEAGGEEAARVDGEWRRTPTTRLPRAA